MKISELTKQLSSLKKKHGDIEVAFNEQTINPEAESEYSIHLLELMGAFKVGWEDYSKMKNMVVLGIKREKGFEVTMNNEPAKLLKKGK